LTARLHSPPLPPFKDITVGIDRAPGRRCRRYSGPRHPPPHGVRGLQPRMGIVRGGRCKLRSERSKHGDTPQRTRRAPSTMGTPTPVPSL
jgi:hypothetical protein